MNERLIGFLSKKCQEGKACSFSFDEIFGSQVDRVYFSNPFGAHPTLGACKEVPMSKQFAESTRFGCEYAVLASGEKFVGYARGGCDKSFLRLPPSDKVIFADGFDRAGISIDANQEIRVKRSRIQEHVDGGPDKQASYYYLELDKNKPSVLRDACFHF